MTGATVHAEAAGYPKVPSEVAHSGTLFYETYVAGREESGCVGNDSIKYKHIAPLSTKMNRNLRVLHRYRCSPQSFLVRYW